MLRVFNLGVGFVAICSPEDAERVRELAPEALPVGEIVAADADEPRVDVIGG